ncbi:MAG: hypothetical protein AAB719_00085 [Patescibacteria group bacterium]
MNLSSTDRWVRAKGYSALSSTYYSIYRTALAQLKAAFQSGWRAPARTVAWCFTWLPLAVVCYSRALPCSNRAVKLMGGYGKMTAGMCNIRQSVLRSHFKYAEAKRCITEALNKRLVEAHTRGHLHVGRADIYWHEGSRFSGRCRRRNLVIREVQAAINAAKEAEKEEPRQAARIFWHSARFLDRISKNKTEVNQLRERARLLAEKTGAKDQSFKMI